MKGKRSRISKSSDWAGRYKDRGREGKRHIRMANTKVCQRHTKVFRISELLSLIYPRLCINSQTIAQYGKEGSEVGMDRKTGRSV